MSSALPPSPGPGAPSWDGLAGDLADRLGTSVGALVGGVVAVLALVLGLLVWMRDDTPPPELSIPYASGVSPSDAPDGAPATSTTTGAPAEVVVHAAGAVARPGVYVLAADARVGDLLSAAGGPVAGADLDRVNLAEPLVDGSRVYVPLEGEDAPPEVLGPDTGATPTAGGAQGSAGGLVDLNTADAAALDTLPGIGPSTAEAIVAHRADNGPFASVDDLLDVRGIGPAKLEAIRDLVTV